MSVAVLLFAAPMQRVGALGANSAEPTRCRPGTTARAKKAIVDFVAARHAGKAAPTSCRLPSASPPSTTTARCGPSSRSTSSSQFAFDRVKALAPQHPEWKDKEPFKAVLEGDMKALAAVGEKGLLEIMAATHAGMTTDEFAQDRRATGSRRARHPRFDRPYTELVYQPMLELLAYLRANGFKTFIVSGGGVEFMRPWTEQVYGIPPEQVVGCSGVVKFEMGADGKPVLDEGGRRSSSSTTARASPSASTASSAGARSSRSATPTATCRCWNGRRPAPAPRFMGLVHHTDAEREWAYDRDSHIGKLDKALDEAKAKGWTVVDMKRDWRNIFPPARPSESRALQ